MCSGAIQPANVTPAARSLTWQAVASSRGLRCATRDTDTAGRALHRGGSLRSSPTGPSPDRPQPAVLGSRHRQPRRSGDHHRLRRSRVAWSHRPPDRRTDTLRRPGPDRGGRHRGVLERRRPGIIRVRRGRVRHLRHQAGVADQLGRAVRRDRNGDLPPVLRHHRLPERKPRCREGHLPQHRRLTTSRPTDGSPSSTRPTVFQLINARLLKPRDRSVPGVAFSTCGEGRPPLVSGPIAVRSAVPPGSACPCDVAHDDPARRHDRPLPAICGPRARQTGRTYSVGQTSTEPSTMLYGAAHIQRSSGMPVTSPDWFATTSLYRNMNGPMTCVSVGSDATARSTQAAPATGPSSPDRPAVLRIERREVRRRSRCRTVSPRSPQPSQRTTRRGGCARCVASLRERPDLHGTRWVAGGGVMAAHAAPSTPNSPTAAITAPIRSFFDRLIPASLLRRWCPLRPRLEHPHRTASTQPSTQDDPVSSCERTARLPDAGRADPRSAPVADLAAFIESCRISPGRSVDLIALWPPSWPPSHPLDLRPKAAEPLQLQGLRTVGLGRFELPTS